MILYDTLLLPHINYGILLWGAKVNKDHKMHLLQKKSVRLITNKHYIAHSESIFKDLRILMIHDMYYLSIVKFYYKLINGHLPDYFDYFKQNFLLVAPDTLSETLLCSIQLFSTNMRDTHCIIN